MNLIFLPKKNLMDVAGPIFILTEQVIYLSSSCCLEFCNKEDEEKYEEATLTMKEAADSNLEVRASRILHQFQVKPQNDGGHNFLFKIQVKLCEGYPTILISCGKFKDLSNPKVSLLEICQSLNYKY
ncbi:unnamed protein product [Trifolium pratense]|uniref:Uncharacterized protein n=1 Tax=Trifolium pratense TaxID=57577 RepID=A0ACB0IZI8_TRIPR|nr:unnamed protein product [Trifolium pratense]